MKGRVVLLPHGGGAGTLFEATVRQGNPYMGGQVREGTTISTTSHGGQGRGTTKSRYYLTWGSGEVEKKPSQLLSVSGRSCGDDNDDESDNTHDSEDDIGDIGKGTLHSSTITWNANSDSWNSLHLKLH